MSSELYTPAYVDPLGAIIKPFAVGITLARGAGAPTNSLSGYAKGCLYQDTTSGCVYQNVGSSTSSSWVCNSMSTPVDVTASTVTLSRLSHSNRTVTLNRAAGIAVTLPAATGSGDVYKLFVGTTVTSNNTTITRAGTDTFFGMVYQLADGGSTLAAYECPGSTVITLNGSTTGGIKGDQFEFEDVATGVWRILGHTSATGVEATPVT